jgi:predicted flap endonuclease-1-like 5' DNA nuclease
VDAFSVCAGRGDCKTRPAGKNQGDDAMKKEMDDLQELKGIGKVLARRLIEASYNTIAKVAAAEEHGLKKIPGMNPQKVRSIVTQAREMTAEAEKSRPKTWKH